MDSTWVGEREKWFTSIVPDLATVGASATASTGTVTSFHGMTPTSAARMIERIDARRAMEQALTVQPVSQQYPTASPIAGRDYSDPGIVTPGGDFPGDNMPDIPPAVPPGYHPVPVEPDEKGNMTLPFNYEKGPPPPPEGNTGGGAGAGGAGAGGAGAGGNKGPGSKKEPKKDSPSYPNNGADVGPPGTQPGTPHGDPRTHTGPDGQWDETKPHGDPSQVPSEHTLPDPWLTDETEHKQAQQNNPPSGTGAGAAQQPPTTAQSPSTDGTPDEQTVPILGEPTPEPSPEGQESAPEANPGTDPNSPTPEAQAETPPQPAEPEPEKPDSIRPPNFLESLIPVYGSARQAIYDFQNGNWVMGSLNVILAISDLFLVKSLFTVGGKLLWKLGETLLRDPAALAKAFAGMIDGVGAGIAKAADVVKEGVEKAVDKVVDKVGDIFGGIFRGGGKKSADDAAREAQQQAAQKQWEEANANPRLTDDTKSKSRPRQPAQWKPSNDGFDDLRRELDDIQRNLPNTKRSHSKVHAAAEFEPDAGPAIRARASSGQDEVLERRNIQPENAAREPADPQKRYPRPKRETADPNNDAEAKIVEELSSRLKPNASGKLKIVVDRELADDMSNPKKVICDDCQATLKKFSEDFPGIKVEVRDMYGRILGEWKEGKVVR
ncbi:hypothetical protein ACTD5D_03880 [Nocardia takedensis]|uniref:hypothetical protein n=1 Tax=Nocardia takedensis TaxID=259390 RepID=UPI00030EEC86|nr:hypothetical protein [Nocardia takedensis]